MQINVRLSEDPLNPRIAPVLQAMMELLPFTLSYLGRAAALLNVGDV